MECRWYFYSGITDISEILLEISIIELQISVMRITDICNSPKDQLLPSTVPRIKMHGGSARHRFNVVFADIGKTRSFQTKLLRRRTTAD